MLSTVSLVLLLVVTCYFQTSLKTLEQQVELDKELLLQLQNQIRVRTNMMQFMKKSSSYSKCYHLVHESILIAATAFSYMSLVHAWFVTLISIAM